MKTLEAFYNALNDQDKQTVNQPNQCKKNYFLVLFLFERFFFKGLLLNKQQQMKRFPMNLHRNLKKINKKKQVNHR